MAHRGDHPSPLHHRLEIILGAAFVIGLVALHAVLIRGVLRKRALEAKQRPGHHLP